MKTTKIYPAAELDSAFAAINAEPSHIIVEAFAGTGKTFTEIFGVVWAYSSPKLWKSIVREYAERKGIENPSKFKIVPSPQQKVVWERMKEIPAVKSIVYSAFNKSIVGEFEREYGWMAERLRTEGISLRFATVNSLGSSAVREAYGRVQVNDFLIKDILCEKLGLDPYAVNRDPEMGPFVRAVSSLVGYCKLELLGWTEEDGFDSSTISIEDLERLVTHYDIELNGGKKRAFDLVPYLLDQCADPAGRDVKSLRNKIDFNDQNWLPVVCDLSVTKIDFLMIDEGQDLPRCKQEFGRKLGRTIMLVGDVNQAIYGFAGADVDSIPRMRDLLGVSESLRLTETRRCGKAIVETANRTLKRIYGLRNEKFVEFKAHESNPAGEVLDSTPAKYPELIDDGDMVLCRVNAPLVGNALQFLAEGRKVVIRGRDFGTSLLKFIDKLKAADLSDLLRKVEKWVAEETEKELDKRNPSEAKMIALADRESCIRTFAAEAKTIEDVKQSIDNIFAGKKCPNCGKSFNEEVERCPIKSCKTVRLPGSRYPVGPELKKPEGVLFSSGHRAKGLEAKRVVILQTEGASIPHPMAKTPWQYSQEWNLLYVMQTRAIETLINVY